ncbi:MAG: hypothetical protein RIS80_1252 [Actinomycetota bacterium]
MNEYSVDPTLHAKAEGVIISIEVKLDVEADKISVDVLTRKDITDEGLIARAAGQIEHALRSKSAFYAIEMQRIEKMAGLPATTLCGCSNESHDENH